MTAVGGDHLELRARIEALTASPVRPPLAGPAAGYDAVVTHFEATDRHGTGALLRLVFGRRPGVLCLRSYDEYGDNRLGDWSLRLDHGDADRPEVYRNVLHALGGARVRRVVSAPYFANEVRTALALHHVYGTPLCTWVMDDQCVNGRQIPEDAMAELLAASALRLAISPELREVYEARFGHRFWLAPPVVARELLAAVTPRPTTGRGVLFGNLRGPRALELLLRALRGSGRSLDWYGNLDGWFHADLTELADAGLHYRGFVADPAELVRRLRAYPFAVVPGHPLDGSAVEPPSAEAIARLSLPSRLPFLLAAAHLPAVVTGSPETAAARFVTRLGVGVVCGHSPEEFRAAADLASGPETGRRLREAAARHAAAFADDDTAGWLFRSLAAGRPADGRFEGLGLTRGA